MKKIFLSLFLLLTLTTATFAADVDDNSIIEELTKDNVKELNQDINLKTFQSCNAMEDVLEDYIKTYWKYNKDNYRYPVAYSVDFLEEEAAFDDAADSSNEVSAKSLQADGVGGAKEEFSETNTQVKGVDESDIIKTDGEYVYYYNQTENAVFIIKAGSLDIIKKINLPKNFWGPVMYIDDDRLVIIASGYSNTDYYGRGYYINRNSKTYTIVFDTTDKASPKLIKLYASDGNLTESRKIGDNLYVLSNNYFNFPYHTFKTEDDIDIDFGDVIPKSIDISAQSSSGKQNLTVKGKKYPYSVEAGDIADCNSIEYSFPDKDTLKETNFNPGYNIISVIDIENPSKEVSTKVIAGSNSNVHMSLDNLYLTESIYSFDNFACPEDALCAMPFFWGGTNNTLIHKLNIDGMDVSYQDSSIVPGSPLNQYSMDEHDDHFRIITSQWQPERSTGLYILDKDLELVSSLTGLGKGETFQSSRFMGDKLFLVTFEQIDPLFAIDLSNQKDPKVLGELKIPGFSTYLHPYDSTHLIGLGYDTKQNEWGGTTTAGLKVDLYQINYDKKCGDSDLTADEKAKCDSGDYKGIIVKQKYTETFGGQGSYSEALNNPRMFVWNAGKKTLLLPATLYERDSDYRTTDFYNGLLSIKVDANEGIEKLAQTTHISLDGVEEERAKECSKYTVSDDNEEPECRELIDGTMYCAPQQKRYSYVPNYCFKDATVWQYIGDKSWQFNKDFIKRALYIGDDVYAISDGKISTHDFGTLSTKETQSMK